MSRIGLGNLAIIFTTVATQSAAFTPNWIGRSKFVSFMSPISNAKVANDKDSVLTNDIFDQVLQVAIEASKKAGDIIVGNSGGAEVTERKANSRDLLTLIDPLCEKVGMCSFSFLLSRRTLTDMMK